MSESASTDAEFPLRGEKPSHPFLWIGNETLDLYVPIMGPDCLAVYAYFARRFHANRTLTHDIRSIAPQCGLKPSTVSRVLEVLEHLQLVKLFRFGGSRQSECQLSDAYTIAARLGAAFDSNTQTYRLPEQVSERLKAEVCAIREAQQGKAYRKTRKPGVSLGGNLKLSASQRSASVSQTRRQRSTRETQTGTHLIRKEERIEKNPTPTPTPNGSGDTEKDKDSPDEDEPDGQLRWARIKFTGVIEDIRAHLLDTNRPPSPHLANGYGDWKVFEFGSLAVEAVEWNGKTLELTLSASDPIAARAGLEKYHRIWEASLRKWFSREVRVVFQSTPDSE